MKLLYCKNCHDIFRLTGRMRYCSCKKIKGKYINSLDAIYYGDTAIPIGFDNSSFREAIAVPPIEEPSIMFGAFIIPEKCSTFRKIE